MKDLDDAIATIDAANICAQNMLPLRDFWGCTEEALWRFKDCADEEDPDHKASCYKTQSVANILISPAVYSSAITLASGLTLSSMAALL